MEIFTRSCPYCQYIVNSRISDSDADEYYLNHVKAKHPEKYLGDDDYTPGDFADA